MEIREYRDYDEAELLALYGSVGWTNYLRRPEHLRAAFEGSLCVLGAREGGTLAGLLRAVGDGCLVVLVQDLLVRPEYQRRGVGRALMEALLSRYKDVYQLLLLTDDRPGTTAFYEAMGFRAVSGFGCVAYLRMNP